MARRRPLFLASVLVAALVLALFGRAVTFDFVNYDDNEYVYDNPRVIGGLTPGGVWWALTDISSGNWHPLTWWSHMLDVQLFGLRPGWHHLTSVLLHAASSVLTFLLFGAITGAVGSSLLVAALFAVHPLHIQSVAWIAERKDVLSGLCFVLALLAYVRYVRRPDGRSYAALLAIYLVGLMAKPMLVSLPVVLLLLDWWPLGRWRHMGGRRLILEKMPLAALAASSMAVTYVSQKSGHSVRSLARYPLGDRVANALTSYTGYIGKMFLPEKLAVFYPLPPQPNPRWWALLAALVLVTITAATLLWIRRRPYLTTGWWWYLVMLLPVIGLIQVGDQSMADRYTYLPLTGLFIAIVWGGAELFRDRGARLTAVPIALGMLLVAALFAVSWRELGYWRGSVPLMARALEITEKNYMAENNYGSALFDEGKMMEAIPHLEAAIRLRREYHAIAPEAHHNLGVALLTLGRYEEAAENFRASLHPRPDDLDTRLNYGAALMALGRFEEAAAQFREVLRRDPGYTKAKENLALAESRMHPVPSAGGDSFHGGAQDRALTQLNTAITCLQSGDTAGAVRHLESALRMKPGFPEAQHLLNRIRAAPRN